MKTSRHERAIRAELEEMEAAREGKKIEAGQAADRLRSLDVQISLLHRILETGNAAKGEEGE